MRQLRALLCGPAGADRDAIEAALEESEHFTIAARADSGHDLARLVHETRPDVLILDELLVGSDARRIASKLALERPLPTLLLVDGTRGETDELAERLRLYELNKRSLQSTGSVARSYTRTRLHLLATRAGEAKRTVPSQALADVIADLRREEAGSKPESRPLPAAVAPLDLILLVVGGATLDILTELLSAAAGLRVPLLVAPDPTVSTETLDQAIRAAPVAPRILEAAAPLRRLNGLLVAQPTRRLLLGDDIILVGPNLGGGLDIAELIMSLAGLHSAGLAAAIPPITPESLSALTQIKAAGTHALLIGAPDNRAPQIPTTTLRKFQQLLRSSTPRRI